MNKNLLKLVEKAQTVGISEDYPNPDKVFQQFAHFVIIEIVGNIYRHFPTSTKAEKLVEEICIHYAVTENE